MAKKKYCEPLRWKIGRYGTRSHRCIDIEGYVKGEKDSMVEGSACFVDRKLKKTGRRHRTLMVVGVGVREETRCGYGTQWYEQMWRVACENGVPLTSDKTRTKFSEGFWRKQVRKGRAVCVEPRPKHPTTRGAFGGTEPTSEPMTFGPVSKRKLYVRWPCFYYKMKKVCPKAFDLSGVKRKRRG